MRVFILILTLFFLPCTQVLAAPVTYQGQLQQAGSPVTGTANLSFFLYDAEQAGEQIGPIVSRPSWPVQNGLFKVELDFGADAFSGAERWLEVWVNGVALEPRQRIAAAPLALHALNVPAVTLSSLDCLAGEVPTWNGSQWICVLPEDEDTLGDLSCAVGETAKWSGSAWECAIDQDTTYTAGSGLVLEGNEFSVLGSGFANVLVVAKSGGDFESVQQAIDSIDNATAGNPWLIWIAPGVYEGRVLMKPYVSLRGAGQKATILRAFGGNEDDGLSASFTVRGADHASIEQLRIESLGSGRDYAVAFINIGDSPLIRNVSILAEQGGQLSYGLTTSQGAAPRIRSVEVHAIGSPLNIGTLNSNDAAPDLGQAMITASGGNTNYAIYSVSGAEPRMIDVDARSSGVGAGLSYAIYNGPETSPLMRNVRAHSSGAAFNYGIYNAGDATPQMQAVDVYGGGGSFNYGIYGTSAFSLLQDSRVRAEGSPDGGGFVYVIYNNGGRVHMNNVIAEALDVSSVTNVIYIAGGSAILTGVVAEVAGGTTCRAVSLDNDAELVGEQIVASAIDCTFGDGLRSAGGASATVRNSRLKGMRRSAVALSSSGPVRLVNSQLIGPVGGAVSTEESLSCRSNYDENLDEVICPP